jgi:hypothetical protein
MKTQNIVSIALILILTVSAFMAAVSSANAAFVAKPPYDTFAYISANPNPVGVGQMVLVTFRVDQPAYGAVANSGHFNGTSVTITLPNNTTDVRTNLAMDATSSGWFAYYPTMAGTYTFQMHFPEQVYNVTSGPNTNQYTYKADDSEVISLTVQEEPIPSYDRSPPLPTDYWTRPVYAENKNWWQVADSWLMKDYDLMSRSFAGSPAFAPYSAAPQSAHLLWTKPIIPGGIAGGRLGDKDFYTGISYEQFFEGMILNGVIFYTEHGLTGTSSYGTRFIDLYTGKDYPLMYMNNTNVAFAQLIETDNPNEHGVIPYLIVQRSVGGVSFGGFMFGGDTYWDFYEMLPDMQGEPRLAFSLADLSPVTGTTTFGPNGEILSYVTGGNSTHRWLAMFNSSRAVLGLSFSGIETWGPSGSINGSRLLSEGPGAAPNVAAAEAQSHSPYMGIQWNVTFAKPTTSTNNPSIRLVNVEEGWLLMTATDSSGYPYVYYDVGFNIGNIAKQRSADGTYPTYINPTFAANRTMIHDIHDRVSNNLLNGVYVRFDEGEEVYYCFNMNDGSLRWQTAPIDNAWALFTRDYEFAYDKLVTSGFDGHVRAFNVADGSLAWDFYKGTAGFENAYGTYPEYAGFTIADHTVYCTADEHSSDAILWRGAQMWAINIDTGDLVWKLNGMYRHPIVADEILVGLNSYDGQLYAFGRGPTQTTVNAPLTQVNLGESAMVTGMVTDQSPGALTKPYPVAAVSEDSMNFYMEYVYEQKELPSNVTGVSVTIEAINPNNEYESLGTATSDASGFFHFAWQPEMAGTYKVIATFHGSEGYGPSYAEAAVVVGSGSVNPSPVQTPTPTPTQGQTITPAPTMTETPAPTTIEPTQGPDTALYVAITAVVIIAVLVAVAVVLRRRK